MSEIALGKDGAPADGPVYMIIPGWTPVCQEDKKKKKSTCNTKLGFFGLQPAERGLLHGIYGRENSHKHSLTHALMNIEF